MEISKTDAVAIVVWWVATMVIAIILLIRPSESNPTFATLEARCDSLTTANAKLTQELRLCTTGHKIMGDE